MIKRLNDKGSLPLVLLVVMTIAVSIATLSSLLVSEKLNTAFSITTDINKMYQKDTLIEVVKNVTKQVLQEKEWLFLENDQIIDANDLAKIEIAVSDDILPELNVEGEVRLEISQPLPSLTQYCEEILNAQGIFLNFECSDEVFDIELKLTADFADKSQTGLFAIENAKVFTDNMGNVIRFDLGEAQVKLLKALK